MDAEAEGGDEIHPSKRQRMAERVTTHVPPEVEPENHDFHVRKFHRSSPNLVVASDFGDSETLRRATLRQGYPVMKSQFLNFGDDVHVQSVRERITATVQRIQPRLLVLAFPSRVWSPSLNYATSPRVREWIDRERAADLAILDWVVSLCEEQETAGTCFSWKIQWVVPAGINLPCRDSGTLPLCSKTIPTCACSGSRIRGAAEPSRDPSGT